MVRFGLYLSAAVHGTDGSVAVTAISGPTHQTYRAVSPILLFLFSYLPDKTTAFGRATLEGSADSAR
jgi:hypothetical protein